MESKKIKIFYFIGTLGRGGAEGQLIELIEGLDKARFSPFLVVLKEYDDYFQRCVKSKIPVIFLQFKGIISTFYPWHLINLIRNLINLHKTLKKEKPLIVHGYLFVSFILGVFMGKLANVPVIITSRRSLGSSKTVIWTPFHRLIEKIANKWTDLVIANSKAVKEDTIKREKLDENKITVVYNCVDSQKFHVIEKNDEIKNRLKKEFNLMKGMKVIGMIANLKRYKNHKMLLDAVPVIRKRLNEQGEKLKVILIGSDSSIGKELRSQADKMKISDCITFAGKRKDICDIFSIMDVSTLTSFEEGFSNAILESMACGVPVVATEVGGSSEAVIDGETGFLVPSGDYMALAEKLFMILNDDKLASKMRLNCLLRVKNNFSKETMVKNTEKVYYELLSEKGIEINP